MTDDSKVAIREPKNTVKTPAEKRREKAKKWRLGLVIAIPAVLVAAGFLRIWPFDLEPPEAPRTDPSLWHLILEDRLTMGLVRLAVAAGAIFAVVSVPALIIDRRWITQFAGIKADDPATVDALKSQIDEVVFERDDALALKEEALQQRDEYRAKLEVLQAEREGTDGAPSKGG